MSTMFDWFGVDWPWCDPLKEEALLWRSSKHFGSWSFDQRCSVNLIIRRILLKMQEPAVDRHMSVSPSGVIRRMLHLSRMTLLQMVLPIWAEIFLLSYVSWPWVFWLLRQGRLSWKSVLWLSYWRLWKFKLDRARFSVGLVEICRLKLLTPGGAINAFPWLPSWLSRQLAKMWSGSPVGLQLHIRTPRKTTWLSLSFRNEFLEKLLNSLIEGSGNPSLIELDLLLGLQMFVV